MSEAPKRLVLIVDDEESMRKVLERRVRAWGFEVKSVRDGEEALRAAAQEPPALVLLDVMMPGLDGLEVCRRLKAQAPTHAIPVIFVTAKDSKQFPEQARASGVDAYLYKPYDAAALLTLIQKLIGPSGSS